MCKKILSLSVIACFFLTTLVPFPQTYAASTLSFPNASVGNPDANILTLTAPYTPLLVKGMTIHPEDPFQFDFIVDTGKTQFSRQQLNDEAMKMIKYFLASLTVPEKEMWVNLSPLEKNRIVSENLGETDMGRDLLAQDFVLKKLTASLIYPESALGKKFWSQIYAQVEKRFGNTNVPVNTFNKVWIVPDTASVYEHGNHVYVVDSHLKVMLESDYKALQKLGNPEIADGQAEMTKSIIRQVILPAIEKEVNEGEHFATLRQMYTTMILATWYKNKLRNSILNQVYSNKNKIVGITSSPNASAGDPQHIYQQYLKIFRQGVYNYIKEDIDPVTNQIVPRKYFSGGANLMLNSIGGVTQASAANAAMAVASMNHAMVISWDAVKAGQTDRAQVADVYPTALAYGQHKDNVIPRLQQSFLKTLRAIVGGKGFGLFDMSESGIAFKGFLKSSDSKKRAQEYLRNTFTGKENTGLLKILLAKLQDEKFIRNTVLSVPAGFTITTEQTGKWDVQMKQGSDAVNAELKKLKEFLLSQDIDTEVEGINDDLIKGITVEQAKDFFVYLSSVENTFGKKLGAKDMMPLLIAVRSGAPESMPGMMDTILNLGLNDDSVEALVKATNPKFAWDSYRRFIEMFGRTVLGIEENEKTRTGFKYILEQMVHEKGKTNEYELEAEDYKKLVELYKEELKRQSREFGRPMVVPQNPRLQYLMAIQTVMRSTFNNRALEYRRRQGYKIEDTLSAVNIVPMVFGNRNEQSGSGVFFTRDLRNGDKRFNLEFAFNAQGEDVVSGRKSGQSLETMLADPKSQDVALQLLLVGTFLESKYNNVQDIEFTFEYDEKSRQNKLYILQTRNAKRTAMADVRTAVEMAHEQIAKEKAAGNRIKEIWASMVKRISAGALSDLLVARFDPSAKKKAVGDGKLISQTGLNASPGAGVGRIVLDADTAVEWKLQGEDVILVREETSPEDLGGMLAAKAILTTRGGRTSHAAVVARQFGIPAVVSVTNMRIDFNARIVTFFIQNPDKTTSELTFKEGDYLAVDGTGEGENGQIFKVSEDKVTREKELPLIPSIITTKQNKEEGIPILKDMIEKLESWISQLGNSDQDKNLKMEYQKYIKLYRDFISEYEQKTLTEDEELFYKQYKELKEWANYFRAEKNALGVGANAEEPTDVLNAVLNGAERIGLVRTEHMFKGDRLLAVQKMMISEGAEREKALAQLLPSQQADFEQIFLLLKGRPATIRLIDPPLHEFLPKKDEEFEKLARYLLGLNTDMKVELSLIDERRVQAKVLELRPKVDVYKEDNPMIGTRGVRLSVLIPEIIEMQVAGIFNAMERVKALGIKAKPEIMVPLVGNVEEFKFVRDRIVKLGGRLGIDRKDYKVGTMIEIIAGAENAVAIAKEAEFFSFGTNDLTQTGLALSRDDGKEFMEVARLTGTFEADPFVSLIKEVAKFVERATLPVRAVLSERLKEVSFSFGVCGEQGVDVQSISEYLIKYLDYVSGNANRIPGAIFISAQLALAGKTKAAGVPKHEVVVAMKKYGAVATISGGFKEQIESAVRYVTSNNNALPAKKVALAQIQFPQTSQEWSDLANDEEFINGKDFQTVLLWAQELKRQAAEPKDGTRMAVKVETGSVTSDERGVSDGIGLVTTENVLLTDYNVSFALQKYLLMAAGSARDLVKEQQILIDLRRYLRKAMYAALGEAGLQTNISVSLPNLSLHSIFEYGSTGQEEDMVAALADQLGISKEQVHERIEKYKESNPDIGERGSRVFFKKVAPFYITLAQTIIFAARERHYATVNIILPFINNSKQISVIRNGYTDANGNVIVPSLNEAVQSTVSELNAGANDDKKIHVRIGAIIETPSATMDAKEISQQVEGPIFVNVDNLTMTLWAAVARDVSRPTGFRDAYLKLGLWRKDIFRFAPDEVRALVIEAIKNIASKPGREVSLIASNVFDLDLLQAAQYAGVDTVVFPYDQSHPYNIQLGAVVLAAAAARVDVPLDRAMKSDTAMASEKGSRYSGSPRTNLEAEFKSLSALAKSQGLTDAQIAVLQEITDLLNKRGIDPNTLLGDAAMKAHDLSRKNPNDLGGISLDAGMLSMSIKRDGQGVPLPVSQQPSALVHIRGLRPVIIGIQESVNVPAMFGLVGVSVQNTLEHTAIAA